MEGDRNSLEERSRPTAQSSRPCQHRVTHRGRNPVFLSSEDFGDEERITDGLPIELAGIDVMRRGELGDSRARQRLDFEADDRLGRGQLAQHDLQRMRAIELVVAVTREDKGRRGLDAPRKQTNDIERLVPPVQVPNCKESSPPGSRAPQRRRGYVVWARTGFDQALELATCRLGDFEERPEGARCEESVARAPEHARPVAAVAERSYERGSSPRRLARDEHEPTTVASGRIGQDCGEPRGGENARAVRPGPRTDDGSMLPQLCASVAPAHDAPPGVPIQALGCASVNCTRAVSDW